MIISSNELTTVKTGQNRLMSIDFGEKNIGIALSDITWTIASPLQLLKRTTPAQDIASIVKLIHAHTVTAIVFGYPINMNGTIGPSCEKIQRFIGKLNDVFDIPVVLWDERLTTSAVTRTLIEADLSRKKRATVVDRAAAAYILQGLLDSIPRRV
jgi:putative holliday junction resolvase